MIAGADNDTIGVPPMLSHVRSSKDGPLGYRVFARDTSNAWLHSRSATNWSHTYEQLSPGAIRATHREVSLGGLQLIHETLDGAIAYRGRPWCGAQVFLSLLPNSGELYFRGRHVPSGGMATHSWDAVDRVTCSNHLEVLLVAIGQQDLDRQAREVSGRPLTFGRKGPPLQFSTDPQATRDFQRGVMGIISDAHEFPAMLEDERGREVLRRRVMDVLTNVLAGAWDTARPLPTPSTRAYVVARAIEFMESRLADPIVIADVCAAVRVCPRTLRYSFETVLGVSPKRYLLATRLNRVRSGLARGTREAIQSVAARWGFWHMGRFAQYYRATFGEWPSETSRLAAEMSCHLRR